MRLLHRDEYGIFKLTRWMTDETKRPEYAILSHTWLPENDQEVTYADLVQGNPETTKLLGYHKLRFCGEQASKDGLQYFWIDTCCIDRSNGAELQESIASMFAWYRNASRCYVYLMDVSCEARQPLEAFYRSRWFTRGWTLQELLAPTTVEFFSAEGILLGDKIFLERHIHRLTGIPETALRGCDLTEFTVDERLSWSANRRTTRSEDKAYCMLGIFGIFMPLIYGEGSYAWTRLQEEIEKSRHVESARLDRVLSVLPVASEAAFNSLSSQHEAVCLPQTRAALLHELAGWTDSHSERYVLWLNGIAGTGKSTVARTVCAAQSERGRLGGSFFFSRGGGDVSNARKLITTLARQLAARIPSTKKWISEAVAEQPDIPNYLFRDQWNHLILGPLSRMHASSLPPTILFVIDALDECDDEREIRAILHVLATAQRLQSANLRILVTSKPEMAIRHSVGSIPEAMREVWTLDEIAPEVVKEDLRRYFESHLSSLAQQRGIGHGWPGMQSIMRLVEISAGLFLWASTACRFILEGGGHARVRLGGLLSECRERRAPEERLDRIYISVLQGAIPSSYSEAERQDLCAVFREVLGSIVVLASPLAIDPLAELLAMQSDDIENALADLHSILHIPRDKPRPIRLHHPALRDFLLNRCRDAHFRVDKEQAHRCLAEKCLVLMEKMLRRDICGLGLPGAPWQDVDARRIQQYIPPALQYACLYWARHYQLGGSFSDGGRVHRFLQQHFLFWLEVVSWMGKSSEISSIMRLYHSLLTPSENSNQLDFVRDARRFIFAFQSIIKRAPLQVYCAGLIFGKPRNQLKRHFRGQMHHWIADVQVADSIVADARDEFNYVNDLVWTPDATGVVSGSSTNVARLWNVPEKKAIWGFSGATDKISSVSISPDGRHIAAGSDDGTVLVWNMKTRKLFQHFRGAHAGWVNSVAFSPDGWTLASGAMDQTVVLWDHVKGQERKRFDNQSGCVNSIAFSPDGKLIATGSVDHLVRLWDVSSRDSREVHLVLGGHSGCVNSVRFSPSGGKRVVSGSDDLTIRLWDTATGQNTQILRGHTRKIVAALFSPNGSLVVSGSEDKSVRVWDAANGRLLHALLGHTSGINAVAFSPNGELLASGSFDDEVRLWDAEEWKPHGRLEDFGDDDDEDDDDGGARVWPGYGRGETSVESFMFDLPAKKPSKAHSSEVACVVFSPDGQFVASSSQDATIKIWSAKGAELWKLEGHSASVTHLAFSPDSLILASASKDQTAKLWDTVRGEALHTLQGHPDGAFSLLFSPDSRLLALADATVTLWSVATGAFMGQMEDHGEAVTDIAFSCDGRFLASCSAYGTIALRDLADPRATPKILRGHSARVNSIAFSPAPYAGQLLLVSCSDDATIRTWDVARGGAPCGVVIAENSDLSPVCCAALSPDMRLIASCGSARNAVSLWDRTTGALQGSIPTDATIRSLSFSLCGRYLESDRGVLDIGPLSRMRYYTPAETLPSDMNAIRSNSVFVARDWVQKGGQNAIWLPEEYRATSVATRENAVVLGHRSGGLTFITMSSLGPYARADQGSVILYPKSAHVQRPLRESLQTSPDGTGRHQLGWS